MSAIKGERPKVKVKNIKKHLKFYYTMNKPAQQQNDYIFFTSTFS